MLNNKINFKTRIILSAILLALGIASRFWVHPWNTVPVAAIALFAGAYLGIRYAVVLPVAIMAITDLYLGLYEWQLMFFVYFSYFVAGLIGTYIRRRKNIATVLGGSLTASVMFFLLTNWSVWQFTPWYAKTWAGFLECFTLALPFFRNTLLGDLFYVGIFFGAYELALYWIEAVNKRKNESIARSS
jgi:hypothetical protein